jgi:hypothetical protein
MKGRAMTQNNLIALVIAASCGTIAAAFATEYLVDKFNKIARRNKH